MKPRVGNNHARKAAWEKLSKPEQQLIIQMMNEESTKMIRENNEKTREDLEDSLVEAMKNNHISQERIQKIINDCNDIGDRKHGIKLQDRDINQYIVLNKEQFSNLIEYSSCNCNNCFEKPEECKLYHLMKSKCVPEPTGYKLQVCKYAYGKEVV